MSRARTSKPSTRTVSHDEVRAPLDRYRCPLFLGKIAVAAQRAVSLCPI
jgi:hypothetical protein